jgi:hypothetical protein
MGEYRNEHGGFFVSKLEERDHLEELGVGGRISNCTLNSGWRDVDFSNSAEQWCICDHCEETSNSTDDETFLG